MKKLHLAHGLSLPLDAITETLGIFGQKGSGKSSTAAVFVEQGVLVGGRFVIVDPTGVWWGLMHDGAGPGLSGIVFGGEHADVPLEPTAGHVVAEFVVQQDEYPVVVLDMKLMRKADRVRFMLAFMETLYHDNREALHVVLDESPQFAPTQAREGGDQIKLLGAVEDVVGLGRARGLGITMIAQRPAMLNANVREQIGTLVAHRLVGSLDRKALKGWIEAQADPAREKEVMEVMAKLKTAEALVWSPAFLSYFGVVGVNAPQTFDSRATPKVGQRVRKPGKRAPVNLDVLREKMSATIEEHEANDPKRLRQRLAEANSKLALHERSAETLNARIMELEVQLTDAHLEVKEVPKVVEVPVLTGEERERLLRLAKSIEGLVEQAKVVGEVGVKLATMIEERDVPDVEEIRGRLLRREPPPAPAARPAPITSVPRPSAVVAAPTSENGDEPSLGKGELAVLGVLAEFPEGRTHNELAFLTGYSAKASTLTVFLSKLRKAGLVEQGQPIRATAAGLAIAGGVPVRPTGRALLDHWLNHPRMGEGERKVLRALLDFYPDEPTHDELCAATGYSPSASTMSVFLSKLRKLGLVEKSGRAIAPEFYESIKDAA